MILADLVILSPYMSASFDLDLTETGMARAYLLVVCQYFLYPLDLTQTALILAYLLILLSPYFVASFDPDLIIL